MNKLIIGVVAVVAVVAVGYWFLHATANDPKNALPDESDTIEEMTGDSVAFTCSSGEAFLVRYHGENNDAATLDLGNDMSYELERAISASGARYASTNGTIVFWEHQGEATVEIDGETELQGCVTDSTAPSVPADVAAMIESMSDQIVVERPLPNQTVTTPLTVSGEARGYWFFEGSAPVSVTNWDGVIIGEGFVTADGDWMTEDFVPFSGTISFTVATNTPYARGALIFHKANPSDLSENDAALEIPVLFTTGGNPATGDIDREAACTSALAYMTFPSGAEADQFVAACIAGEHPEVIERYKEQMNIDE